MGAAERLAHLRRAPLAALLEEAWSVTRRRFPPVLTVAAPGNKRYRAGALCNGGRCFPAVSVTGSACALGCDHCGGLLLRSMIPAGDPAAFPGLVERLAAAGAGGFLLTGGCTPGGRVPLEPYLEGVARAAALGLRVVVHTGLVTRDTARALRRAGVSQVLLDLIGAEETIRRVYHLDRRPEDYRRSLEALLAEGVTAVPHIVVGLHYGQVLGEYAALEWVAELRPAGLVLVALAPLPGTAMADVTPPPAAAVARLAAAARLLAPDLPLSLGCARPAGPAGREVERLAVDAGATSLAYASEATLRHAAARGLEIAFHPECCSLSPAPAPVPGR